MAVHPYVEKAEGYCRDIIAGKIPASEPTIQACQRHLDDLARQRTPGFSYYFDPIQAERVCKFGEFLPHVKGKWARKDRLNPSANKIRLEPWQCFVLVSLFGWLRVGTERKISGGRVVGLRRFTEADLWIARKNAKSTLAVIIGLWMFSKDDEPGAEVYCGAGSEKQAWEVFGPARQMCKSEESLQKDLGILINAKSLHQAKDGNLSKFEPVIGNPGDGASPHCAIVDEYHEHKTSTQFDTFQTGTGAREQSLLLVVSTAGQSITGPARDRWGAGLKLLKKVFTEEHRFVLIYTLDDPDEEWKTEHGLRKANPNWGVSVNRENILAKLETAKREADAQNAFRIKHANVWVTAAAAYFNFEFWKKCESKTLRLDDFKGQTCHMAGDLATKVNLAATAKVFALPDERFAVFGRYYSPRYTVELPQNRHLARWAEQGWLTVHEGQVLDFNGIRDDIFEDCETFQVAEVAMDPWQAVMMINQLREQNVNAYELRQIVQYMSGPMKDLDALMKTGRIEHDGNPITSWCIANVVAQKDRKENVYPRKERDADNIDGAVALIMALGRAMLNANAGAPGFAFL